MASARIKHGALNEAIIERIGSLIGWMLSKGIRSGAGKEMVLSSMRRAIFEGAADCELPPLVNRSALTSWEKRFNSQRTIGEVASGAALMRNAWVAAVAKTIPEGALVLDAGAGECQYKPLLAHTEYRAQDFAQYYGMTDGPQQEQWHYGQLDYVCDITDIPVDTDTFDAVICTEVLEHLSEPVAALEELTRVLKPGGVMILSAPLGCGLHQEPHHYFGGFTPWFYRHFFEKFGIEPVEITPLGGLFQHVAQECYRVGEVLKGSASEASSEGELSAFLMSELPRMLASLDDQFKVEQFTVGYVVRGVKKHPKM